MNDFTRLVLGFVAITAYYTATSIYIEVLKKRNPFTSKIGFPLLLPRANILFSWGPRALAAGKAELSRWIHPFHRQHKIRINRLLCCI